MVTTLVTGATGTLGSELTPRLLEAGHDVRAASRSPPDDDRDVEWVRLDVRDEKAVRNAVTDVDVVVHTASAPRGDSEAVDVNGTRRLVEQAAAAEVENFLYVSIVGVDEIPFSYYDAKVTAEQAVEAGDVPWTILRATQFHSFVDEVLGSLARLPVLALPTKMKLQPVSSSEVADAIVDYAEPEPAGRVPDMGGPDVLTAREIATQYREVRGLRRPIVRLPVPGSMVQRFREGKATCPDQTVGTITWRQWLERRYET